MLRLRNWCLPLVALALALSFTAVRALAEDAKKDTGTVSGVATDADGKPVAGAEIGVYPPMKQHKKAADQAAGAKGDKPIPVVPSVKSDDKGEFTISDVPAGSYTVVARLRGTGQDRKDVTVAAGETAKVELKLHKGAAGGGGAAPAGGDKPADPAK